MGGVGFSRSWREKKKRPRRAKKNWPSLLAKEGIKKSKKNQSSKKNCQDFILASQFFFLARKDFSENFFLGILVVFIRNVLPLSFFFLKKYHTEKKNAKKLTWLTNNFSWRLFGFFEKVTLKKKHGQESPRSPRTGNP